MWAAVSAFCKARTVAAGSITTGTLHSVCLSASTDVTASSSPLLARRQAISVVSAVQYHGATHHNVAPTQFMSRREGAWRFNGRVATALYNGLFFRLYILVRNPL